jgi:methylglutaconyl-CoA hydratase
MTEFKHLQRRREGSVEYLVLNRPEVRNAFNEHLIDEMTAWAAHAAQDSELRVVVLSGAGPVFCAGGDLVWMSKMIGYTHEDNMKDATAAAGMFAALDNLPVPLIARIHGAAIAGGAGLAAVADIAVTESNATFGFSEVKLGLVPSIIASYVLAKIGPSAARDLFLTGRRFDADHAKQVGLVHSVVPSGRLDQAVQEYVDQILSGGREAIAAAKKLIRQLSNCSADEAKRLSVETIARQRVSAEAQVRMKEFLAKGK